MRLHPLAWAAWLSAVTVFAVVVTNPLYVLLAIGAVVVVHVSAPPDPSPSGRAVRALATIGVGLIAVRVILVPLGSSAGQTTMFVLPRTELPHWLGGFGLGGPVTAEVVAEAAGEGLRLVLVLVAFGVLNAHADLVSMLRQIPPAFRDLGLVVAIGLAFVPSVLRTVRDVRDAQRMRGERGLRSLAPSLVVPVLGWSVERALLLAESMDARGYGRAGPDRVTGRLTGAGLAALVASVVAWVAGLRTAGTTLAVAGGLALVVAIHLASRASGVTRLAGPRWAATDTLVAALAVAAAVAAVALDGTYDVYPAVTLPPFGTAGALVAALLAAPAAGTAR